MKQLILFSIFSAGLVGPAEAETIRASVNGLVCSFCAAGIEKTFKALPEVDTVRVDLDSKLVTIGTRPDRTLDDATITKSITDAGYSVTAIRRED